ncbi:MAG: helix-turn-helix transcriptional regulator [Bradyrhizobium sp.]|nr:helix-turn-helix transcriptional regulator [Pseudomonadota bacterium]MDE2471064.1 helix-turn-helix transcriptional regulator [Bradyrhizobium sp.]
MENEQDGLGRKPVPKVQGNGTGSQIVKRITLDQASCRTQRTSLGWSHQELAKRSGFSVNTIVEFEEGRRALSEAAQVSLSRALRQGAGRQKPS